MTWQYSKYSTLVSTLVQYHVVQYHEGVFQSAQALLHAFDCITFSSFHLMGHLTIYLMTYFVIIIP